jgi:hypothetical protein
LHGFPFLCFFVDGLRIISPVAGFASPFRPASPCGEAGIFGRPIGEIHRKEREERKERICFKESSGLFLKSFGPFSFALFAFFAVKSTRPTADSYLKRHRSLNANGV